MTITENDSPKQQKERYVINLSPMVHKLLHKNDLVRARWEYWYAGWFSNKR